MRAMLGISFCMKKLYNRQPVIEKKVGERTDRAEKAVEPIYAYLTENSDERQFSLNDLISKIEGDYCPDLRIIKTHLLQKYGEDILIIEKQKKPTIVCFQNTGFKILTNAWYDEKKR